MNIAHEASLSVLRGALRALLGKDEAGRLSPLSATAEAVAERAWSLIGEYSPQPDQPCDSIFNLLDEKQPPRFITPQPLKEVPICPQFEVTGADLQGLQADISRFSDLDVNQALFLLDKWAWAISAGEPGLSWAEVVRLAAAVAGVLAKGAEQVSLVAGDIPGIQSFIYTISAKGALKSLRARSFYVELLSEEVARRILDALGLSRANLIYTAGGHLYLLVPGTEAARQAVTEVGERFNLWLRKESGERLFLALGMTEGVTPQAVAPGQTNDLWGAARSAISDAKAERFRGRSSDFWDVQVERRQACQVCHQEMNDKDDEPTQPCDFCQSLFQLGGKLPKTKYLVLGGSRDVVLDGTRYEVSDRRPQAAGTVLVINSLEAADYVESGRVPLWLCNFAVQDAGGMVEFSELAERSTGAKLLGVLRMDVDNLGKVFLNRLPERYRDFARSANLSRSLTRFFKLHLEAICKGKGITQLNLSRQEPHERPVVVIYAGGDDLFIVGAWDQTLELAFDIRRAFHDYTGGRLTLSGGVVAADYMTPMHHLAKEAETAEKEAKELGDRQERLGASGTVAKKDAIALLWPGAHRYGPRQNRKETLDPKQEEVSSRVPEEPPKSERAVWSAMPWAKAEELLTNFLMPVLHGGLGRHDQLGTRLPRSFMYRLLALADTWLEHGPLYLPQLAYLIARLDEGLKKEPDWKHLERYLMGSPDQLAYLPAVIRWLDLLCRGGNVDGTDTEKRAN